MEITPSHLPPLLELRHLICHHWILRQLVCHLSGSCAISFATSLGIPPSQFANLPCSAQMRPRGNFFAVGFRRRRLFRLPPRPPGSSEGLSSVSVRSLPACQRASGIYLRSRQWSALWSVGRRPLSLWASVGRSRPPFNRAGWLYHQNVIWEAPQVILAAFLCPADIIRDSFPQQFLISDFDFVSQVVAWAYPPLQTLAGRGSVLCFLGGNWLVSDSPRLTVSS